jgi:hypothetical protein
MEPEKLLGSQEISNGPYPLRDGSIKHPHHVFLQDYFNVTLPSMLQSFKWYIPFKVSN